MQFFNNKEIQISKGEQDYSPTTIHIIRGIFAKELLVYYITM